MCASSWNTPGRSRNGYPCPLYSPTSSLTTHASVVVPRSGSRGAQVCLAPAVDDRGTPMDTSAISYRVADFLKKHPPFQAVDEADLLELASRGRVRFHEANEYI